MPPDMINSTPQGWMPLMTAIANVGFSIVVAWYLLSKAIPRLQDRFSEDLEAQRLDFEKALEREKQSLDRVLGAISGNGVDLLRRLSEKLDGMMLHMQDLQTDVRQIRGLLPDDDC
jgi:hypothetical protein